MGLLNRLRGNVVYLDTNIFIYFLEGHAEFEDELKSLFKNIDQGALQAVTSELALAELLVKPFQDENEERQSGYQQAIQSSGNLAVQPVSRQILVHAAKLSATTRLRLPDAIHAATAALSQCETFLTNDQRFKGIPELHVVVLSEAVEEA